LPAEEDLLPAEDLLTEEDLVTEKDLLVIAASSVSVMACAGRAAAAPRERLRAMPFSG
jgi:hypothetical protein